MIRRSTRRLNATSEIIEEESLKVSFRLVRSYENKEDRLMIYLSSGYWEKGPNNLSKVIHDRCHFGFENFQIIREKNPSVHLEWLRKYELSASLYMKNVPELILRPLYNYVRLVGDGYYLR